MTVPVAAPIRILVVDDEDLARQRLRTLLSRRSDFEIVGECATGEEAVRAIRAMRPDLVLLDVQMPELDGFDVISEIGAQNMPAVIFATAFDEYALDAFDVGAVDYLLKPVDEDRFNRTLDRAAKRLRESGDSTTASQLSALLRKISSLSQSTGSRFAVKVQGKVLFLDPAEIYWIQARDDVARVHLADSAYDVREPLSHLEARLPASFLRVHRSVIVNTSHVRAAEPFDQGDQMLILRNGKRITTGRSYRKVVQEFLRAAT